MIGDFYKNIQAVAKTESKYDGDCVNLRIDKSGNGTIYVERVIGDDEFLFEFESVEDLTAKLAEYSTKK